MAGERGVSPAGRNAASIRRTALSSRRSGKTASGFLFRAGREFIRARFTRLGGRGHWVGAAMSRGSSAAESSPSPLVIAAATDCFAPWPRPMAPPSTSARFSMTRHSRCWGSPRRRRRSPRATSSRNAPSRFAEQSRAASARTMARCARKTARMPCVNRIRTCICSRPAWQWAEIGNDAGWTAWIRRLAELAVSRFIRKDGGALGESYTAAWQPAPGLAGRIIEPGHQFEWAWLLLAV